MIVVTTPTGQIGRELLPYLLDSAEPIRVIARDPSRLETTLTDRVEVVQGSHDDIDVVTRAFAGASSVLWVLPPDPETRSVEGHYLDFTWAACDAIRAQDVRRVVAVSTLGRGADAGHLSAALAMEELLIATGTAIRVLRMPFFMENLLNQMEAITTQGMFFLPNDADRKLATVATRDVGAAAAGLLLDRSWDGQDSVPVVGSIDLSPNDMADVMSEVLKRSVHFQQVPGQGFKATMLQYGMSDAWAQGLVDMATAQNDGFYDAEPGGVHSTGPTTFRTWCEDVLKPAVEPPDARA
ncbi:MAG: NAD(P)H-binding protein [Actinomycetota bacterium]|nr:NAD(P)H-binding protein [Actinomycetota bacterium]